MFGVRIAGVLGAAAMLVGLGLGVANTTPRQAHAAEPTAVVATEQPVAPESVDAASSCFVTPKPQVRAVIVRSEPRVTSASLGQINQGRRAAAACTARQGGWYSASGCTRSNWWVHVTWHSRNGWVALGCVRWYRL